MKCKIQAKRNDFSNQSNLETTLFLIIVLLTTISFSKPLTQMKLRVTKTFLTKCNYLFTYNSLKIDKYKYLQSSQERLF